MITAKIIDAGKRLKTAVDAFAATLDPKFPHDMQTDDFYAGKKALAAKARRNRDGSYDVTALAGSSFLPCGAGSYPAARCSRHSAGPDASPRCRHCPEAGRRSWSARGSMRPHLPVPSDKLCQE